MVRKFKHHEKKLLRKVDFLEWKNENNIREISIIRRYQLDNREEYKKYSKIAGEIKEVANKIKLLNPNDPFRKESEKMLLEKLYRTGIITSDKTFSSLESVSVSALCRRRLSLILCKLKMVENVPEAVKFIKQGHVRVGPETVNDPAFLVTRNMEDFVTWVDTSKIKAKILKYNNEINSLQNIRMDLFDDLPPPKKPAADKDPSELKDAPINEQSALKPQIQKTNWGPQIFKPVVRKAPKNKKISFSLQKSSNINNNAENSSNGNSQPKDVGLSIFEAEETDVQQESNNIEEINAGEAQAAFKFGARSTKKDPTKPLVPNKAISASKVPIPTSKSGMASKSEVTPLPVPNSANQKFRFDLSEFLPENPGSKKGANKKSKNTRFTAGGANTADFDENEIYDPEFPTNYMAYKSWVELCKKKKLEAYFHEKRNSSKEKAKDEDYYSSDNTIGDSSNLNDSLESKNLYQDVRKRYRDPVSVPNASTGEEAYQARLRLSQAPPSASTYSYTGSNLGNDASKIIVLKNMAESDQVDNDLKSEIISECGKFGQVVDCWIKKVGVSGSSSVHVFVEFESLDSSKRAVSELDGRLFDGRAVTAHYHLLS
ncbi:U3 small nucleolar ribonucleoprotein IMP3 [Smittium mucronatum]|uniref:U3 small nucleolar ribonucleoprotein protein IMP3 n=1 Tax=Smittium mucronatum TaxID=133383 RepID=A0A1R0H267_9FUNG|nr:U3 small nucleolar ribonucleoprotein IMP3 [Smittium mucronatum]